MRVCVLGSSASAGQGIDDLSQAWPWLVGARLSQELGEPVDVTHHRIFAYGPKAVDMAVRAIDDSRADLIIYVCFSSAVRTVANRVRRRFGNRAYRIFRRAEDRFEAGPAGGAKRASRANRAARWLARTVIGTDPHAPLESALEGQAAVVHALARYEQATVLVYFAPKIPRALARANKGADAYFEAIRSVVEPAATQHHFLVADGNDAYDAYPDRDNALYAEDLLHRTVAGHRVEADVVLAVLLAPPSPYAAKSSPVRPAD